ALRSSSATRGPPSGAAQKTRRTRGRQATKEWLLRAGERLARSRTRRSFLPRLGESTVVAEICARLPAPGERVRPSLALADAAARPSSRASFRRASVATLRAARRGYLYRRSPDACLVGMVVELAVSRVAVPGATWLPSRKRKGSNEGVFPWDGLTLGALRVSSGAWRVY